MLVNTKRVMNGGSRYYKILKRHTMKHRSRLMLLIIVAPASADAYVLYQRQASSVQGATTNLQEWRKV